MDWHEGFRRIRVWHCVFLFLVPKVLEALLMEYASTPQWSLFVNSMVLYPIPFTLFLVCATVILRDIGLSWGAFFGRPKDIKSLGVLALFPAKPGLYVAVIGIQIYTLQRLGFHVVDAQSYNSEGVPGQACPVGIIAHWKHAVFYLSTGILAPIQEEILYRGFVLSWLAVRFGNTIAVILSSIVFGFAHQFVQVPTRAATGLLEGVARVYYRTLWIPIALHIANNAVFSEVIVNCLKVDTVPFAPMTHLWYYLLILGFCLVCLAAPALLRPQCDDR